MRMFFKKSAIALTVLSCSILGGLTVDTNRLTVSTQTAQATVIYPTDSNVILGYINDVILNGMAPINIIYPYPGFVFTLHTEAEFNTITIDDESRFPGGLTWAEWQSLNQGAWERLYTIAHDTRLLDTVQTVDALKVSTINGHALPGTVVVTKANVGLGNADNTSDANKPISTATQTALDGKANEEHGHFAADIADASEVGIDVLTAENAAAARAAIGAGTGNSNFDGTWTSLSGKPSTFTPSSHSHVISDTTGLQAAIDAKSAKASFTAVDSLAAHGVSAAATNANDSFSGNSIDILGISVPTNTSYNNLVNAYNDLAAKYNDMGTKFNTILTWLGTNRTAINNLKAAGAL